MIYGLFTAILWKYEHLFAAYDWKFLCSEKRMLNMSYFWETIIRSLLSKPKALFKIKIKQTDTIYVHRGAKNIWKWLNAHVLIVGTQK